jgi:hypothetical protein
MDAPPVALERTLIAHYFSRVSEEPNDSAVKTLLLGVLLVLVPGLLMLGAIPELFPTDSDEADAQRIVFVILTAATTVACVAMSGRTRRRRRLASGMGIGYVMWLLYFAYWVAIGP